MDNSESRLDIIEAQRSTNVSHDHLRRRSFPMNLMNSSLGSLSSRDSLQVKGDAEPVAEFFFMNLRYSDLFDLPGEYIPMNPEIFSAASAGNKECLESLTSPGTTPMACLKSDGGDSVLHLASAYGHLEVVKIIICECPCLLLEPNWNNQLPIHVAAGAGHLAVVEALATTLTFITGTLSEEEEKETLNLYVVKDTDGDIPLHLALKGRHMKTASFLVKANQRASLLANKDGISPLYLTIESGNDSLVNEMLTGVTSNILEHQLEGRKHLVHAALKAKNTDIIDAVLEANPSFGDERDEEGRTCLSFGASVGFYDGVCKLLDRSTKSVYVCDNDGSFPIHSAVEKGDIEVVKEILKRCPDSKQLLNKHNQNILHIASCNGSFTVLLYLTFCVETLHMRSKKDVNGNTPFHLATQNWRPRSVVFLVPNNLDMRNNNGLTALDIAESNLQPSYIFMERVTLMLLLVLYPSRDNRHPLLKRITVPSKPPNGDKGKEYVNTLLLVAALIATVAFAAGFTIPGGFNSSAPNLGMATLANNPKLMLFLLFDTLAMQSSVLTIVTLIWAQLGDPALVQRALNIALPSLFFSLLCMPVAFYCGVLTVFANVTVIVAFLSITSLIFFYVMLFILGPHVVLQIPGIPGCFGSYLIPIILLFNADGGYESDHQPSAAQTSAKIARNVQETS